MAKWKEIPPSPEAIVRAAWKLADAVQIDGDCNGVSDETWAALASFRSLASDAEVAAIIKKAGEDRG